MDAEADLGRETAAGDPVPGAVRGAVYAFLTAVVVCGLLTVELWPFTGWRLFAEVRTNIRTSWSIVAVDPAGEETVIHLEDLPLGYRHTTTLLPDFEHMAPARRDAICDAWAGPIREDGGDVDHVRIDRVVTDLADDGAPTTRTPAYRCGEAPSG